MQHNDSNQKATKTPGFNEGKAGLGHDDTQKEGNEIYVLPNDEQEQDRLSTQHKAFSIGFGGLYPAPEIVRAVLAPQEGVTKRILDLGCGSGIWCTEMAREFPHCDVLGVDLAPVSVLPEHMPANCKFEINDIVRVTCSPFCDNLNNAVEWRPPASTRDVRRCASSLYLLRREQLSGVPSMGRWVCKTWRYRDLDGG